MDNLSFSLTTTKLQRPPAGSRLLRRPRLIALLEQGRQTPLTLVSAPAGSGKTTLLSDWLATCPAPSAWLSLDEGDSDLAVFLNYFIAALRTVCPEACPLTLAAVHGAETPSLRVLASLFSNELEALRDHLTLAGDQGIVLVLDDYHHISGQAVNNLLIELLRHPSQTLHLVLATRSDPALPLPTLRARRQMVEIRRQDLRFTLDEARAYLQQAVQGAATDEVVSLLTEKTEGWITGLYLATLNLRHSPDTDEFVSSLLVSDRLAMDYLLDEVLSRQPDMIQEFLLTTSLLDRLCGPLCQAVSGVSKEKCDAQACLEWLEETDLFIVALDEQRQWYRYHHLFQQLLRYRLKRRMGSEEIAELHRRASLWLAQHGFVDEAIAHALAAGDKASAVDVIERYRHEAMNHERWQHLESWLRLIPPTMRNERPELLLAEAWILHKQWRFTDLPDLLARIESLLAQTALSAAERAHLQGEADVLRCVVTYYAQDGQRTFELASRALQTLPTECSLARGLAWMYYGGGLQVMGRMDHARAALIKGMKEDRGQDAAFSVRMLIGLCLLNWMAADLTALQQTAAQLLRLADDRGLPESAAWAHYFLGCVAYQRNDLASAADQFAAALARRYMAHSAVYSQSSFGLAAIYRAQGAGDQAQALAESVLAYGLEAANPRVLADGRAFLAWLALRQGRSVEAHRWAESLDAGMSLPPMTTLFVPALLRVQVLLDQAAPVSLHQAADLLARLHTIVESRSNQRFAIDVLALQAWLDDLQGRTPAALTSLRQAVALAQPQGIVRAFVDLGPAVRRLLTRLRQQGYEVDFIDRLLQAFPPEQLPAPAMPQRILAPQVPAELVEPLTFRELEILELLAQRLSAKEIAQRLVISDRTVKRHTANVYQKLGVHGRQQAVNAGRSLGLLSGVSRQLPVQHS